MKTTSRLRIRLTVLFASAVTLLLVSAPAFATESESTKYTLPESTHEAVGLFLIAISLVAVAFGLDNARRQMKGDRDQADGKWRWR